MELAGGFYGWSCQQDTYCVLVVVGHYESVTCIKPNLSDVVVGKV